MSEPDRCLLDASGSVDRQGVRDLLMHATLEPVMGPVSEHSQHIGGRGETIARLAQVAGLDQVEGLPPGVAKRARFLGGEGGAPREARKRRLDRPWARSSPTAAPRRSEMLLQIGEGGIQALSRLEQGQRGIEVPELA